MTSSTGWTILGSDEIAQRLRQAATVIDSPTSTTIVTGGDDLPDNSIAVGPALALDGPESALSSLFGYRVLESTAAQIGNRDFGRLYGLYGSVRLASSESGEALRDLGILPLLAYALGSLKGSVTRVMAKQASLFSERDAWFISLRLENQIIITLEALACNTAVTSPEILVEVTGSDRVVRAEPTRQSIQIERQAGAIRRDGWLEDPAERLLEYVAHNAGSLLEGTKMRVVWRAALASLESGQPVAP